MATIEEIKNRIDLHDLAEKLGIKRPGNKGNYHCPRGEDSSPSLSIFSGQRGQAFKCHKCQEGGSAVDLVMHARGCDAGEALKILRETYNIPAERRDEPRREKTTVEYIADRCLMDVEPVVEYLTGRGIGLEPIRQAIAAKTLGFNTWTSPKAASGEVGYGGPAAAFIVRTLNPGHVAAVDMRYLDPSLNGGVKTQTQGEKQGVPWVSSARKLVAAHTVVVVESAINALSVETVGRVGWAALATRGTGNLESIDWRILQGKRVLLCFDNDKPDESRGGHRPGPAAAWRLHEVLTGLNVSALMIDQTDWDLETENDINDILKAKGVDALRGRLDKVEEFLIPGLPLDAKSRGKRRVFLPAHDFAQYWKYRVKEDFTRFVTKLEKKDDGSDEGEQIPIFGDLCGFRVASISRVSVASSTSMMTGDKDHQPTVYFAVSVQTPRHGHSLVRRVFNDDRLHNTEHWKKFGPVFKQNEFLRMINILERAADIGSRKAVNFVGLAWRDGRLIVNEGPDCYFTEPEKQCPYHNLSFPSGNPADAREVLRWYQRTFKDNAAALPLVWALGGHLKAFLGFWPHMVMQADKGAGKSTLIKRLERSIAFTMFSGQSLMTEFRLLTSISHTSHPVGWEELSARKQEVIDKAAAMLQESYQYSPTRRGADMTEYLQCAPVLLAGEDVPVRTLTGKLVKTDLTGRKGDIMPDDLPAFPVRQWLQFLTRFSRAEVQGMYQPLRERCIQASRASGEDDGAVRMAGNYAALIVAWRLLCEFAGIDAEQGDFERDLLKVMNTHIAETSSDRAPWVWILETILSEIAAKRFHHPYAWESMDAVDGNGQPIRDKDGKKVQAPYLLIRTSHVMDHLAHANYLRDKWNGLPVKSDRVFKRQLQGAGVVPKNPDGSFMEREKTLGGNPQFGDPGRRIAHLTPISLQAIAAYGLHATPTDDMPLFADPRTP